VDELREGTGKGRQTTNLGKDRGGKKREREKKKSEFAQNSRKSAAKRGCWEMAKLKRKKGSLLKMLRRKQASKEGRWASQRQGEERGGQGLWLKVKRGEKMSAQHWVSGAKVKGYEKEGGG